MKRIKIEEFFIRIKRSIVERRNLKIMSVTNFSTEVLERVRKYMFDHKII